MIAPRLEPARAALMSLLLAMGAACEPGTSASPPTSDLEPLPTLDLPLTVEEAYAAIPHRQTRFQFDASAMSGPDASYLRAALHLIDEGTRARVAGFRDLYHHGSTPTRPVDQLDTVIAAFDGLRPPDGLTDYHEVILTALEHERGLFADWQAAGPDFGHRDRLGQHPRVRAASTALHRAYGLLMARYGEQESAHNRKALFDYHCALDFL